MSSRLGGTTYENRLTSTSGRTPGPNPGCRAESSLMFSLDFDWKNASLMSVMLLPGYDWKIFLDELARLECAALGDVVYGKSRCEPKT